MEEEVIEIPTINDNDIITVHSETHRLDIMIKGDKFKRLYNGDRDLLLKSWNNKYEESLKGVNKGGIIKSIM